MFLLIYNQSDLNFEQFDLNFDQIIYSYSGEFVSTATTVSSSFSRNFTCGLQLRGIRGELLYALLLIFLLSRGNGAGLRIFQTIFGIRMTPPRHSCLFIYFLRGCYDNFRWFFVRLPRSKEVWFCTLKYALEPT